MTRFWNNLHQVRSKSWHVSGITFIRYAQNRNQKIRKPNNVLSVIKPKGTLVAHKLLTLLENMCFILLLGLCCSIFSLLCSVLRLVDCPFVLFSAIVRFVLLRFSASDYPVKSSDFSFHHLNLEMNTHSGSTIKIYLQRGEYFIKTIFWHAKGKFVFFFKYCHFLYINNVILIRTCFWTHINIYLSCFSR